MGLCTICTARDEFTVVGNTDTFTLSFDYVEPRDVNVAVKQNGEYVTIPTTDWEFENYSTIKISPPPQADVIIYRCTDVSDPAATFFVGNSIKAEDLNANQRQVLNAIEELRCAIAACCDGTGGGGGGTDDPGIGEPCDDGVCAPGLECINGICLPPCDDGICPSGYECVEGICLPECDDGVCPTNFVCVEGVCLPECEDGVCPNGFTCVNDICLPDCSDDGICPEGFVCVDGTCLPDCSDDGICPEGFTCIDGVCQPIDGSDAPRDGEFYGRKSLVWEYATYSDFTKLTEAPAYSLEPVEPTTVAPTYIGIDQDAPYDGKSYGRIDGTWDKALPYADQLIPLPGSQGTGCVNGNGADSGGNCVPQTCDSFIWDCYPASIQVCADGCYDAYASTHGCDGACGPTGLQYKWEEKVNDVWTTIQDWSRNVRYTFTTEGLNVGDTKIARITSRCSDFPGGEVVNVGNEFTVSIVECGLTDSTPPTPPDGELEITEAPNDGLMYGRKVGDWNKIIQQNISAYPPLT